MRITIEIEPDTAQQIRLPDGKHKPYESLSFIYALCCPYLGTIRYVGRTRDVCLRMISHFSDLRDDNGGPAKREWVEALRRAGKTPLVRILEVCPREQEHKREAHWVRQFPREHLLNA